MISNWMSLIAGVALLVGNTDPTLKVTFALDTSRTKDQQQVALDSLRVALVLDGVRYEAKQAVFTLPEVVTNVPTVAQKLGDLDAQDNLGDLTLTAETTAEGIKQWLAQRDTVGPIQLSYAVPVPARAGALGVAPPIEPRVTGSAVSAGTGIVVLEPRLEGALAYQVSWQFPKVTTEQQAQYLGVSTLGIGSSPWQRFASPAAFSSTYFMLGDIGSYRSQGNEFMAAWQGKPPFDAQQLMQWAEQLYAYYNTFFAVDQAAQYVVFMRDNDINPGGGMARGSSFILTYDEATDVEQLKGTLSHEMFHTFLGGLSEPTGLAASWFSEGLAVYYQWLIPLRAGMATTEQFLKSFNRTAVRYYTNLKNDTPNHEVPEGFWLDTRVRVLPYDRGSLYFASLNARIRKATNGKQDLSSLLVYLREQEQQGQSLTIELWLSALERYAGADEVERFHRIQNGELVELEDDVLGERFERCTATFRRYELGFEPAVLTEDPRRIRGLKPNSAAAKAGLRNGDIIVQPVPQDAIQGDQNATLTLMLERDGRQFEVTYLPRGERVSAPQWRLKIKESE